MDELTSNFHESVIERCCSDPQFAIGIIDEAGLALRGGETKIALKLLKDVVSALEKGTVRVQ